MSVSEQPHLNDPIVVFRGDVPCLPFAEWAVHDYPQVAAAWRLARHARPATHRRRRVQCWPSKRRSIAESRQPSLGWAGCAAV
jgi:hypothetical protein